MDDLELETRLRTHLHRRFDDPPIPAGLVSCISQALATEAGPVGLATRVGRIRLGWAAVAAAVAIAVAAIGIGKGIGPFGPGAGGTPTPQPTASPGRWFVVLPPGGMVLNKPEASLAGDILSARIRAIGIGTFTSGGGYGIQFLLPVAGPSDASIRAVLGATGDVRIVPLPASDYGAGKLTATLGLPLPKDEPALIGWDGIASVASDPLGGSPDLTITLKPAGAQAFGDYTAAHVGDVFAIVVDGRVALLPTVTEAITSAQITITRSDNDSFAETAAILVGGMLPESWRGASVPVIVSQDQAITAALAATHGGTVQDASPTVDLGPLAGALRAVWYVDVHQPDCQDTGSCVSSELLVVVDAVTGTVISIGPQGS
jgi:hypothetical protein